MLVDPTEGIPPLVDSILSELEINRLANPAVRETMNGLTAELNRLSAGPLSVAERELLAAQHAIQSITRGGTDGLDGPRLSMETSQVESLSRSLAAAGSSEDDVIETLERLITELSSKTDYRRFARLIAELREDQLAHEKSSHAEIGVETLPLEINELSRASARIWTRPSPVKPQSRSDSRKSSGAWNNWRENWLMQMI